MHKRSWRRSRGASELLAAGLVGRSRTHSAVRPSTIMSRSVGFPCFGLGASTSNETTAPEDWFLMKRFTRSELRAVTRQCTRSPDATGNSPIIIGALFGSPRTHHCHQANTDGVWPLA